MILDLNTRQKNPGNATLVHLSFYCCGCSSNKEGLGFVQTLDVALIINSNIQVNILVYSRPLLEFKRKKEEGHHVFLRFKQSCIRYCIAGQYILHRLFYLVRAREMRQAHAISRSCSKFEERRSTNRAL